MMHLPAIAAALLTLGLVVPAELHTDPVMLILGRFVPGGSWVQAGLLALYAAWVAHKLMDPKVHARLRPWLWRLFSAVFFVQLLLGMAGLDRLLLSGRLHPPVPAVILAGPVFRGEGLFMVFMLLGTLVLAGPTWCSHLCYIGSWDDAAARARRRPGALPPWRHAARAGMLALVLLAAWGLRLLEVPPVTAGWLAVGFGGLGVAVMLAASRRLGVMVHCLVFCPIGLVVNTLGRLHPFRIGIDEGCTRCGACTTACRYQALEPAHLEAGRPGFTCSLCAECLPRCSGRFIRFRFLGLGPQRARTVFVVAMATLHASFLGLGMI
jgi:polyferredoxin